MKAMTLIPDVESNRKEWLEVRKHTIGSSEIVTVCGLNPWKSALSLWAEKTGRVEPEAENEAMRLGRHMESYIGDLFARETAMEVSPANTLYRHPKIEWATASPDFFVGREEGVVECKNVNAHSLSQWEDGKIPNYAHMQTLWQLGVLGLEVGWVAALVGANTKQFFRPEVKYAADLFDQMVELGAKFMDFVRTDTPPAATASDLALLERLNPRDDEKTIDLPVEAGFLLAEWDAISHELEQFSAQTALEGRKNNIKAQLIQMLGGATKGVVGERVVTAKTVNRAAYQAKASSYTSFKVK